jgi:hypothetical protein
MCNRALLRLTMRCMRPFRHGRTRIHPQSEPQRILARAALRPRLRRRLSPCRPRRDRDHEPPLGAAGRRSPARPGSRPLGVPSWDHRRPALLPRYELGPGAAHVVGAVRRLAGRARDLGRHRGGNRRRHLGPASPSRRHPALPGRGGARPARRAGDRPHRQLLQPGAVRRPDPPAVGAAHRSGTSACRICGLLDLPPDVPLRDRLELDPRRVPGAARPHGSRQAAWIVRALRRRLLRLPHLRGDAAR